MDTIKLLTSELGYGFLGNINSNFLSISFDPVGDNGIKIRVLLKEKTELEEELIEDALSEFEAIHGSIDEMTWEVLTPNDKIGELDNCIYRSMVS